MVDAHESDRDKLQIFICTDHLARKRVVCDHQDLCISGSLDQFFRVRCKRIICGKLVPFRTQFLCQLLHYFRRYAQRLHKYDFHDFILSINAIYSVLIKASRRSVKSGARSYTAWA